MNAATLAYLRNKLATNPAWATRALVKIYTLQTEDEQASEITNENNGVGFTGCDANILSSFAKQVNAGRTLSPKQMVIVFKKMGKYAVQVSRFIPEAKLVEIQTKLTVSMA